MSTLSGILVYPTSRFAQPYAEPSHRQPPLAAKQTLFHQACLSSSAYSDASTPMSITCFMAFFMMQIGPATGNVTRASIAVAMPALYLHALARDPTPC